MASKQFSIDVAKFGKKAVKNTTQVVRWIVLDLLRQVIIMSPVGDPSLWKNAKATPGYVGGRFRGNWQTSVGMSPASEIEMRDEGVPRGQAPNSMGAMSEGFMAMAIWNGDGTAFITNNMPYAEELEKGHSTQAPLGIVAVTLVNFPGIVRKRAKESSSK